MIERGQRDVAALGVVAAGLLLSAFMVVFTMDWARADPLSAPSPQVATPAPTATPVEREPEWITLPDGTEVLNDGSVVTSTKMLVQMAEDLCPTAMDYGNCDDVDIRVVDFFDPQVGEANHWVEYGGKERMGTTAISLDPDLVGSTVEMVEHVIVHEWNHAEQATLAGTKARYEQMEGRADAYFIPRVVKGEEKVDGLELLTDCMTVFQDGAKGYDHYEYITAYVDSMLGSRTMAQACGTGWEDLLPTPLNGGPSKRSAAGTEVSARPLRSAP